MGCAYAKAEADYKAQNEKRKAEKKAEEEERKRPTTEAEKQVILEKVTAGELEAFQKSKWDVRGDAEFAKKIVGVKGAALQHVALRPDNAEYKAVCLAAVKNNAEEAWQFVPRSIKEDADLIKANSDWWTANNKKS